MEFSEIEALKRTIHIRHGGTAYFVGVELVQEAPQDGTALTRTVCVFNLAGNVTAVRVYAWAEPAGNGQGRRFLSFLHRGPIKSPRDAVRAAIAEGGGSP